MDEKLDQSPLNSDLCALSTDTTPIFMQIALKCFHDIIKHKGTGFPLLIKG